MNETIIVFTLYHYANSLLTKEYWQELRLQNLMSVSDLAVCARKKNFDKIFIFIHSCFLYDQRKTNTTLLRILLDTMVKHFVI